MISINDFLQAHSRPSGMSTTLLNFTKKHKNSYEYQPDKKKRRTLAQMTGDFIKVMSIN